MHETWDLVLNNIQCNNDDPLSNPTLAISQVNSSDFCSDIQLVLTLAEDELEFWEDNTPSATWTVTSN